VMGYVEGLCDQLIDRKIELVIIRIAKSIFDRQLVVEELFDDPYVVAAGVQNPWTRRRKVQLAELVNERWVLLPFDSPAGSIMAQAFRASGVEPPRATVFTHSLNLRYKLLATGRFLSSLPRFSLTLPGRPASIKALPLELPGTRRPMGIITLRGRTPGPLAQRFIDGLRGVVKPLRNAK
jgi:DNA-binding transcriptional LysR family regulator